MLRVAAIGTVAAMSSPICGWFSGMERMLPASNQRFRGTSAAQPLVFRAMWPGQQEPGGPQYPQQPPQNQPPWGHQQPSPYQPQQHPAYQQPPQTWGPPPGPGGP